MFGIGLALTSGSLAALGRGDRPTPRTPPNWPSSIAANLAATVLRFLLFRAWVFPDRRDGSAPVASTVVASHHPASPASPTYATSAAVRPGQPAPTTTRTGSTRCRSARRRPGTTPPSTRRRPSYSSTPYSSTPYSSTPYGNAPYTTTQFGAGEAADRTWGDATMRMRPVAPHDQDSRNAR